MAAKISKIGVIGAGKMGAGIAQIAAAAGLSVKLADITDEILTRSIAAMGKSLARQVDRESITQGDADKTLGNIETGTDYAMFADCDLVIEAVFEDMKVKKEVFSKLDEVVKRGAILASNTSSLSLTRLASSSGRPDKVIGMHFFNPVPMMALVEIIRALQTSDETFRSTDEFTRSLGKTPVSVKDSPGFVVNRMLVPMINEATFILYEGLATAEEIDAAMKLGAGHPMGPLALADMIGIDVCLYVMNILLDEFGDSKFRPCPLLKQMVAAGYLGRKSGKGFFDYAK